MLPVKPTKGLASILSSQTLHSGKSFRSIMRDATAGLPLDQRRLVKRTLFKLNSNPGAVVTNIMSKQAIKALGDAGVLRGKYQTNAGMAISHVQKMHEAGAPAATPAQKKEQEHAEARKAARLQRLARARREEAEGHLTEAEVHDHRPGDINKSSLGMKEWRGAKVSISQKEEAADELEEQLPVVEMNIG